MFPFSGSWSSLLAESGLGSFCLEFLCRFVGDQFKDIQVRLNGDSKLPVGVILSVGAYSCFTQSASVMLVCITQCKLQFPMSHTKGEKKLHHTL